MTIHHAAAEQAAPQYLEALLLVHAPRAPTGCPTTAVTVCLTVEDQLPLPLLLLQAHLLLRGPVQVDITGCLTTAAGACRTAEAVLLLPVGQQQLPLQPVSLLLPRQQRQVSLRPRRQLLHQSPHLLRLPHPLLPNPHPVHNSGLQIAYLVL